MAATHVHAVDLGVRQTVSWSQDDRIAVSADKEVIILKLDMSPNNSSSGFRAAVMVRLSTGDLTPKQLSTWTGVDHTLLHADRHVRSNFLKRWTYNSLASEDQVSTAWSQVTWSPIGVGVDNRTVLACLTRDHRILVFGQSNVTSKWIQLADLGEDLMRHHHHDFQRQYESLRSHNKRLTTIFSQMLSVAAVEMAWSTVFEGPGTGQKEGHKFVLLFVLTKNGDVVTWKLLTPFTGIESCGIVGRQSLTTESTITTLAWTTLPHNNNSGILAVGDTVGQVELLHYHYDPTATPDHPVLRCTQMLHDQADRLAVSSLTWINSQKIGLTLLCTKEEITSVYTVSVDHHGDTATQEGVMTGSKSGGQRIHVLGSSHERLGDWLRISGVHCVGQTVVMSAEDGSVSHLSVTGSARAPVVKCVRKLPYQLEEKDPGWGCVDVHLSPNGHLCLALFRPNFSFNYLSDRFRYAAQVHICPVPTPDLATLEQTLAPDRVAELSMCGTDILEFSRLALCLQTVPTATIGSWTQSLTSSPYTDTVFGCTVARHLLSTLCFICKSRRLTAELEEVKTAQSKMTDRLLCQQISSVLNAFRVNELHVVHHIDLPIFNTMLNWIRASSGRAEMIGSEVMNQLTSVVGQAQPDICIFCDSEVEFNKSAMVTCANKHSFGLCCHTASVCNTVTYQCCSTCGTLALSRRQLAGLTWLPSNPSLCTLCGSFLYSSNTGLRF